MSSIEPRNHSGRATPRRLAPVEERFWLLHEGSAGSPICNETILLRLRGPLDPERLRAALDGIVARHAPLRTAYVRAGSRLLAEERAPTPAPFEERDVARAPDPEAALEAVARELARTRFDLATPPLLRAACVRVGEDDHALVVCVHHIAADGRSFLRVIPRELANAWAGAEIFPLAHRYEEFAAAQRDLLDPSRLEGELAYWREALAGAPSILALPTDRPHPPRPSTEGERLDRMLGAESRARIAELAQRLGVRTHHVMLGAWALLLARYAGEDEVLVGVPVANRDPGFEDLVGCFINNLVVRVAAPDDDARTFAELASAVQRTLREAREHGDVPFGEILDRLELERDPSRSPVYQAMFNYLPFSLADVAFDGLEVSGRRVSAGIAMMDLSLDVTEEGDRHRLTLEYDADVFDRAHAERMLGHYVFVLEQALEQPDRTLARFELVPDAERALIEPLARGPALRASTGPRTFHGLVFAAGRAHPERIAAELDARRLTYAELEERALGLARRLVAAGVEPGDRVALAVDDALEALPCLFGVMAAGAAYVPIDAGTPDARLAAILADAGVRVLVTDRTAPAALDVDVWSPRGPGAPGVELPAVDPASVAYVIYTSGSTGRPKGVEVTHANVAWQCDARAARYDDPPGRLLAIYSFAFDSSVAGITWTLLSGGTLSFLGPTERKDPRCVRDAILARAITHLDAVPSMYAAILDAPGAARSLRTLRVVICGGEALPATLVAAHFAALPGVRLFNEYGPTEATVFATVAELGPRDAAGRVAIGTPVGGAEAWLLDARGRLAPLGHPGELHLGGAGVAKGYLGAPELTRARFLEGPDGRRYRTGDRARLRDDGAIEFLGRTDAQVQIRGFRVELGEIEEALRRQPGIADAAAVLLEEPAPRLVGYVVAAPRTVDSGALRATLAAELPAYMVPTAVVPVEAIPRTSRGKLDKKALPAPPPPDASEAPLSEPPADALERALVAMFEELLPGARAGRHDGFFALGGHSLLAVKLLDRIDRQYGVRVPLAEVFRSPTVAQLAALVRGEASANELATLEVLRAEGSLTPFFFVGNTNQARMLLPHLEPERPFYAHNVFGLTEPADGRPLTVGAIAERYLADLRAVRPRGPYAIGGYCVDAKVALEIAHRLRAAGEVVEVLVIIDGVWFLDQRVPPNGLTTKVRRLGQNLLALGPGILWHKVQRRIEYGGQDLRQRVARLERRVRSLLEDAVPLELEQRVLLTSYFEALEEYEHRPFAGRTVVIIAEEWQAGAVRIAPGEDLAIHTIFGHHETIFEGAQLTALGAMLRRVLAPREAS